MIPFSERRARMAGSASALEEDQSAALADVLARTPHRRAAALKKARADLGEDHPSLLRMASVFGDADAPYFSATRRATPNYMPATRFRPPKQAQKPRNLEGLRD